jgi:hypothetical protein
MASPLDKIFINPPMAALLPCCRKDSDDKPDGSQR